MSGAARAVGAYVPCFNDGATVRHTVQSLLAQTVRPAALVVIDDGSNDGSADALSDLDVRVVRHDRNRGRGAARARAMELLPQEFVLCCDATNVIRPDFVEKALHWFADERVAAVFGRFTQAPARTAAERWRGRHLFKLHVPRGIQHRAPLATFGTLVRADAVRSVGGFDARLRHTEDGDLGARLIGAGFDVIQDPSLDVESVGRETVGGVLERYWRWYAGPDERATWSGYLRNVWYAARSGATADLRDGDPASAAISLLCPHYQFWRSRLRRARGSDADRAAGDRAGT